MRVLWVDPSAKEYFGGILARLKREFPEVEFSLASTTKRAIRILENVFKIDVLVIEIVATISVEDKDLSTLHRAVTGAVFLKMLRDGSFEPLNRKDMPIIIYTTEIGRKYADMFSKNPECGGWFNLDTDNICLKTDAIGTLVNALKAALEHAKLQPGEVRVL